MANTPKPAIDDAQKSSSGIHQTVAQVAVDLHIARRNLLIYPPTHEQALRSLGRAYKRLCLALSKQPDVTIVVMKDGLAIGKDKLPATNSAFKDLSAILKQYQIVNMVFTKGLEEDELVRFLKLLVKDRETILKKGGFDKVVTQAGFVHISVQTVDYSRLHVTEEDQIDRATTDKPSEGSIWEQFVTHLCTSDQQEGDGSGSPGPAVFDPQDLARMLNENKMDVNTAIDQYEALYAAASDSKGQPESLSEGLPQFQHMIKALTPALQNQFLSATFNQCDQLATMADTARLVDGLGGELILRMLKQASDQGKTISPSLLTFVKKMTNFKVPLTGSASPKERTSNGRRFEADEVGTLLAHEQYDQYVDKSYGKLLEKIARKNQKKTSASSAHRFQEELKQSLTPVHINSHVGRAMMKLMKKGTDITDYRQWARQISYFLEDLLECHAFIFLINTLNFFTMEKNSTDSDKSKIAGLVLDRFTDPQFVARALEIVQELGDQSPKDAMDFLSALGEPVVIEIFDGLDPNDTFYASDCVEAKLMETLVSYAAREALERMDDPRPEYVRRMVRIVRRMGDSQSAERVRPLLRHADIDIRMEALATLLTFGNKWGLIRLRDILDDPSCPEFQRAIELAGRYKVSEVLPQLIAYAERSRGDYAHQEAALRALGNIGDSRAIPTLAKLARNRWSLSKKHKDHIKQVVFETLEGYPHDEVKDLLHYGLKQKDAAIQACCKQVYRKQRHR